MAETFARPASGDLSRRIHGAENIMRSRAGSARSKAARLPKNSPEAAALRGKAKGYDEAADLLARLDHGDRLPPKSHRWAVHLDTSVGAFGGKGASRG